ncbi:unnamed protein product, partial [Oppiella nova]
MLATNKVNKICQICGDNKGVATRVSIGRQMSYKFSDEKEFIRNDEENRIRKQLIRENKLKQNECNKSHNSVDTSSDNKNSELVLHKDFLHDIIANTLELSDEELTDQISEVENFLHDIIANTLELSDEDLTDQISEIESYVTNCTEIQKSSHENELSLDRLMEKSHTFVIKPVFRELTDYKGLNQLEFSRISELLSATTILKSSTTKNILERFEKQISDFINFTQMLNSFTTICSDDQFSLIKNGAIEMILLRFFTYFNESNYSFTVHLAGTATVASEVHKVNEIEDMKPYIHSCGPLYKEIYDL